VKRVLKTRHFSRWMRKTALSDKDLLAAVAEMEAGLIDADLGGGVIKKRVALPGRGKSGSVRVLVATRRSDRWFFVFGFEKNQRASVADNELEALQNIARDLLRLTNVQMDTAIAEGSLEEIRHDSQS